MALIQVGAIVFAVQRARRVEELLTRVERDVKPLVAKVAEITTKVSEITAEAGRGVSVAVAQIERVDRLTTDVAARLEQTLTHVQHAVSTPARQGAALLAGLRAGFEAIRHLRERRARHGVESLDDEHAFIG
jgi:hypothetical protein